MMVDSSGGTGSMGCMRPLAAIALLASLAACGYTPPPQANTSAPSYRADLDKCEDEATAAVRKQNAKRFLSWLSSPVRRWSQIGDEVQVCMAGKGYGRTRWCTPAELRDASRAGNLVVTATGIQCAEPPVPERRRPG